MWNSRVFDHRIKKKTRFTTTFLDFSQYEINKLNVTFFFFFFEREGNKKNERIIVKLPIKIEINSLKKPCVEKKTVVLIL